MLGYESTVRVTLDEMLHHTRAVVRGTSRALVVADMPFLSYGVSVEESVEHAGRFLSDAGADAVKVEGGVRSARTIEAIVGRGIAVMGHIGLTPQAVSQLGGFRVQGRSEGLRASAARRCDGGPGGRRVRGRARAGPGRARPGDHRAARDPDDRHRRGPLVLGRDPGHHRCRRSDAGSDAPTRATVRRGRRPRSPRRWRPIATPWSRDRSRARRSPSTMETDVLDDVLGRNQLDRPEQEPLAIPLDRDL